jgi:hypothetical protein
MTYLSPAPLRFFQGLAWAVLIWTLLQFPMVQQSFMGGPDMAGLRSVLQLQQNLVGGEAAPAVLVDFGDSDWAPAAARRAPAPPPAEGQPAVAPVPEAPTSIPLYVPRQALADILDFLRESGAVAVFVDVDTSYVPSPEEDRIYADAIARWRATPTAPLLAVARTNWRAPSIFERNGQPPPTPGERVTEGTVRIWANGEQIVDSVEYWSCEGPEGAEKPRASVTLYLAAAARFDDPVKGKQAVDRALAGVDCKKSPPRVRIETPFKPMILLEQSGPIHYHLGLKRNKDGGWTPANWPTATLRPAAAARCGTDSASAANMLRAADILAAIDAGGASRTALCGAIVAVGASAEIVRDVHPSPYGDLPGAFILANAARGLDFAGPLRRFPYFPGLLVVLTIAVIVFFIHEGVHRWSDRYLRRPARSLAVKGTHWLIDKITHPISFSLLITQVVFAVGLVLTFFTIRQGYWGVFAASALAASMSNAFDDVSGLRKYVLKLNEQGKEI